MLNDQEGIRQLTFFLAGTFVVMLLWAIGMSIWQLKGNQFRPTFGIELRSWWVERPIWVDIALLGAAGVNGALWAYLFA